MRRIPSQIPSTVSRLLQGQVLQTPPTWYTPALSHPPPQLPPYQVKQRARPPLPSSSSHSTGQFYDTAPVPSGELERRDKLRGYKQRKSKPAKVFYEEDNVRRQFFKDFPYEALRPISLVEGQEIDMREKINGLEWERLEQRGEYPTVEDCVEFVVNLKNTRGLPITEAYEQATEEFVQLRARHQLATVGAELEARHYGAQFKRDAFERHFDLEEKALDSLAPKSRSPTTASLSARVKHRAQPRYQWTNTLPQEALPQDTFTGGEAYMARWRIPAPVQVEGVKKEGDLVSLLGGAGSEAKEGEQQAAQSDELDFLKAALNSAKA
ncbi:hypothetical protein B9479_000760 [Cryptococcus floricola]|uniref:Small ribosomal subunit protein mS23 n=1 Tax=Cryptococcus floricola TaxID=2591691 RepID=A0A5D3B7H7_9TREE|nr:hypothetical protein B9479_000760 [Cryptococcus floricola]